MNATRRIILVKHARPAIDPAFGPAKVGAPEGEKRSFKSLSQAARENADSRVFIGIHFRFACDAGLEQGKQIGEWVAANRLKPREG